MNALDNLNIGDMVEYTEVSRKINYFGIAIYLGQTENGYYKFLFAKLYRQDPKNFSTYEVPKSKNIWEIHPQGMANESITIRKISPDEVVDF